MVGEEECGEDEGAGHEENKLMNGHYLATDLNHSGVSGENTLGLDDLEKGLQTRQKRI